MIGLGTSTANVDLSMSTVYAENRELVDDDADRYFLVRDGVEKAVIGGPDSGSPPVHPEHEKRGRREIPVAGGVVVEPDDVPANGQRVWLKGYGCVRHTRDAFEYVGDDIAAVREEGVDVIHWAPADANAPVRLRTPDGDVAGVAEPGFADAREDEVVQFERVGFARVDDVASDPVDGDEESVAYFAHP